MAEAKTAAPARTVRLQVAPARQEESGQGIARMPRVAFQKLGVTEGDVVTMGFISPEALTPTRERKHD